MIFFSLSKPIKMFFALIEQKYLNFLDLMFCSFFNMQCLIKVNCRHHLKQTIGYLWTEKKPQRKCKFVNHTNVGKSGSKNDIDIFCQEALQPPQPCLFSRVHTYTKVKVYVVMYVFQYVEQGLHIYYSFLTYCKTAMVFKDLCQNQTHYHLAFRKQYFRSMKK